MTGEVIYGTGNPVPSADAYDRHDNTRVFDSLLNGAEPSVTGRTGKQLKSWAGFESDFAQLLINSGYEFIGDYDADGPLLIERVNQVFSKDGEFWRPSASLALPYTTVDNWATDQPKFVSIGDAALRQELATPEGAGLVGYDKSLTQVPGTVGAELTRIGGDIGLPIQGNLAPLFAQGILPCTTLWCADSNGTGAGQPYGYRGGYLGRLVRSLMNTFDEGFGASERGYMYESVMDPFLMLSSEPGWAVEGPVEWLPTGGGVTGTLLKVPTGSAVTLTGREVSQCKIFYKYAAAGSVRITVNGVTASEHTLTTAGRSADMNLAPGGAYIKPTDIIRIETLSGELLFQGFRVLRKGGSRGPITFVAPQGSQGWDDFFDDARCVPLTNWVKDDNANGYVLLGMFLGTNNIVTTVGKQKSPTAYVASMDACIQKYRTNLSSNAVAVMVWVPPRPNQATFAPYEDYVAAILEYASTRDYIILVRMDLAGIEGAKFMTVNVEDPAPGLHYGDYGHSAIASILSQIIGITPRTQYPTFPQTPVIPKLAATAKNTWTTGTAGSYLGADGFVDMVGGFARNGATDYIFGNVAAAHIPADNVLTFMIDDQGVSHSVVIRPVTGQLELADQSVTGITFLFTTGACRYKLS